MSCQKALIVWQQAEGARGDGSLQGKDWPVRVQLSNGRSYGADLVISAIGVDPNASWLPHELQREPTDGGVLVDRHESNPVLRTLIIQL